MVEDKRLKKPDRPQLPVWAAALFSVAVGSAVGLTIVKFQRAEEEDRNAVANAIAAIVRDDRFWDQAKESGYVATLRPELSTNGLARIDFRCVREVVCAPPPHRKGAKIILLTDD